MSISLKSLWKIGLKAISWLSGAQKVIQNGSTFESIHAELYRNDQWQVLIEVRKIIKSE